MTIQDMTLPKLTSELKATRVVALSRSGVKSTAEEVIRRVSEEQNPFLLVGGFPTGRFTPGTLRLADDVYSIDPETLDTWVVVSRLIYEYERSIGLPLRRWNTLS